jgi:hypothetical protein
MANSNEAMREALVGLIDGIFFHCDMSGDCKGMPCEKMQKAKAALAAPPRNCDVGTADEQCIRYQRFCNYQKACCACPLNVDIDCRFAWAQMPYEEGGAK